MLAINPVVSIIVPVYNKELYISRCLSSLHNQFFKNFEVIIVNDGSTDSSAEIIAGFLRRDNRFRYFEQTNQGVSSARNIGLAQANGEWLTFVDADDYIEETYLFDIMKTVAEIPADLYLWGIRYEFNNGKYEIAMPENIGVWDKRNFCRTMIRDHYKTTPGIYGYVANKLIRRNIVEKYQLRFSTKYHLNEDFDFYLSYYDKMQSAYIFRNSGYHYAQAAAESSVSLKNVNYLSLIDIQYKCLNLIKENEALTSENESLIRNNIQSLAGAAILETHHPGRRKLLAIKKEFDKRGIVMSDLLRKRRFLNFCLHDKTMLMPSVYLKCWRNYISFRTR